MIDVFKIGIHMGMTTNSGQVLALMVRQLTGVGNAANHANTQLSIMAKLAAGAASIFVGEKMIKGLLAATKHAEKLNHELVKIQTGAQLTDAQTKDVGKLAFQIGRDVHGSNAADNVKVIRELFGVFGNFDTAKKMAPEVIQASRATSNFVDKDTDLAQIAIRALELRGHITKDHKVDPAEFSKELDAMVRSIVASEGLIKPADVLAFVKQAGPAARTMTTDSMWGMMPAIMNALGSSRAGTAMNSLFSQMVGHVVAGKRVAVAMEDAGMLTPGKWRTERGGKVIMDQDAVPEQAELMANPVGWLHKHLEDMRTRKDKDGKPIDVVGIIQQIFQLASRATTQRFISDVDANYAIIENEMKRFQRMPAPGQIAKDQNEKDASVNLHNFQAAWDNFLTALGGPGIPIVIGVLQRLTSALDFLQKVIIEHPTAGAALFYIAGGLAALLILSGSMLIFSAAVWPLTVALRALVAITGLASTATALTSFAGGVSSVTGIAGLVAAGAALVSFAAGIGAIMAIAKLGSDAETPANRAAIDALAKQRRGQAPSQMTPQDGFGPDGRPTAPGKRSSTDEGDYPPRDSPFSKHSYLPPRTTGGGRVMVATSIQLDGRTIARAVSEEQERHFGAPPSGPTRFDPSMSPSWPGNTYRV